MKKYLLKIGLFFAIVLLVDLSFGFTCKYLVAHAKGGTIKQVDVTVNEQKADIVILGSSRAHHHYVPAVLKDTLGLTAYNGGVDGNGLLGGAPHQDALDEGLSADAGAEFSLFVLMFRHKVASF